MEWQRGRGSRLLLPTVRTFHSAVTCDGLVCRAFITPHSLLILYLTQKPSDLSGELLTRRGLEPRYEGRVRAEGVARGAIKDGRRGTGCRTGLPEEKSPEGARWAPGAPFIACYCFSGSFEYSVLYAHFACIPHNS